MWGKELHGEFTAVLRAGEDLRPEATRLEQQDLRPEAWAQRVTVGVGRILPRDLVHLLGAPSSLPSSLPLEKSADGPSQAQRKAEEEEEQQQERSSLKDLKRNAEVAICGPPAFTDDMEALLKGRDIGLASDHIHTERWW